MSLCYINVCLDFWMHGLVYVYACYYIRIQVCILLCIYANVMLQCPRVLLNESFLFVSRVHAHAS